MTQSESSKVKTFDMKDCKISMILILLVIFVVLVKGSTEGYETARKESFEDTKEYESAEGYETTRKESFEDTKEYESFENNTKEYESFEVTKEYEQTKDASEETKEYKQSSLKELFENTKAYGNSPYLEETKEKDFLNKCKSLPNLQIRLITQEMNSHCTPSILRGGTQSCLSTGRSTTTEYENCRQHLKKYRSIPNIEFLKQENHRPLWFSQSTGNLYEKIRSDFGKYRTRPRKLRKNVQTRKRIKSISRPSSPMSTGTGKLPSLAGDLSDSLLSALMNDLEVEEPMVDYNLLNLHKVKKNTNGNIGEVKKHTNELIQEIADLPEYVTTKKDWMK